MDRRNDLQITAEVLRIAWKGALKSHIGYEAKLNYKLLLNYLDRLKKQGLIAMKPGNRVETTQKGRMFLKQYKDLITLVGRKESLVEEKENVKVYP